MSDKAFALASRQLKSELLALKRNSIIEQASHLFYELGYSGTTLELVADRLHVTKPFLYSYFKNKEAILSTICELGITKSLEALEAALEIPGSERVRLIELVRRVGDIVIEHQEQIVVYQREMKNLNEADAKRILALRLEFDRRVAALVKAGNQSGDFSVPDDSLVSVWIGGLVSWLPLWYSNRGSRSKDDIIDKLVASCLRMVGAPEMTAAECRAK